MKKTVRMNERELHRMISESVKSVLRESEQQKPQGLKEFMRYYYDNDSSCEEALSLLDDDRFLRICFRVVKCEYQYSPKAKAVKRNKLETKISKTPKWKHLLNIS